MAAAPGETLAESSTKANPVSNCAHATSVSIPIGLFEPVMGSLLGVLVQKVTNYDRTQTEPKASARKIPRTDQHTTQTADSWGA